MKEPLALSTPKEKNEGTGKRRNDLIVHALVVIIYICYCLNVKTLMKLTKKISINFCKKRVVPNPVKFDSAYWL